MSGLQLTTFGVDLQVFKAGSAEGQAARYGGRVPGQDCMCRVCKRFYNQGKGCCEPAGWKLHLGVSQTQRQLLQRQRTFELFLLEVAAICALCRQQNMGQQLQVALRSLMSCWVVFLTHTELQYLTL